MNRYDTKHTHASMYTNGRIECKGQGYTGVEPERHTSNCQRYWLQLAIQRDTQVDYTLLVF